ncbi:MAG: alpha/beta fold hydrolase [Sulfitobacter sp.]
MYVMVDGARIYFDVDGEGLTPDGPTMREKPTVILVHGGPGADHSIYKPFYSQLTDIAQVVYYDHRGNGRSDFCDKSTWTLAQWGDDLKGLCDALGIEKPIVMGTSFGGFVTLSYAARHPDQAGGLVLTSTAAKVDFPTIYRAFERRGGPEVGRIAQEYWDNPTHEGRALYRDTCLPYYQYGPDTSKEWVSRSIMKNDTALWFNGPKNEHGRMDFRQDLSRITCPVLVMVGEEDPITPPEFSDEIAALLPQNSTTYLKFAECGHGIVGDKPQEALTAMRDFIRAHA